MSTAKVLVIENPQEDPTVIVVNDSVEVVITSSYVLSKYALASDLDDLFDPQHFARLADRFPVGTPPFEELMRMQRELDALLEER